MWSNKTNKWKQISVVISNVSHNHLFSLNNTLSQNCTDAYFCWAFSCNDQVNITIRGNQLDIEGRNQEAQEK